MFILLEKAEILKTFLLMAQKEKKRIFLFIKSTEGETLLTMALVN